MNVEDQNMSLLNTSHANSNYNDNSDIRSRQNSKISILYEWSRVNVRDQNNSYNKAKKITALKFKLHLKTSWSNKTVNSLKANQV